MPPLANVRIRAAIKLGLPISEIDHLLDNLGAQRIAIVHEIHGGYLAWGTTRYIALEQKLKDDDTYAVVVSFGFGHNALICRTAEQADKVARRIVAGANVTESAESRIVGAVDLGGEQVQNLYKLVSSEKFKPVPVVLTHGRGFTLFDDKDGTSDITHHNLGDYLTQHRQFALVINNGWFYIAAISDDRKALEKFARKLMKQSAVEESASRIVGRVPFKGNMEDAADIFGKSGSCKHCRYCRSPHCTVLDSLEQSLEAELAQDGAYATIVTFASGNRFVYTFLDRRSAEKFVRMMSKADALKESASRVVGRPSFSGSVQDTDDISAKYGACGGAVYCYTRHGVDFHASAQLPLEDLLERTQKYAVVVSYASDLKFVYTFTDRGPAEKFARRLSKQAVSEAIKSDVTDLGTVETDKTITADKGGLRNYLRGKFNVLGINREVYSNYHHSYGGSAHDGEYYLPNSDAHGPLTSLADRLVTQRVFEPGTKSSDLAIVRFIHNEAAYSLDIRYVIGFKPAVEKLVRSVRSDAAKLEALPDPGKL